MKLFPSLEVMQEATKRHVLVEMSTCHWNDETEFRLWESRCFDNHKVTGTLAGILEMPRLVPEFHRGRLS